jgi:hypothetical protein
MIHFDDFGWYLLVIDWCIAASVAEPEGRSIEAVVEEVFAIRELKAGDLRPMNIDALLHPLR